MAASRRYCRSRARSGSDSSRLARSSRSWKSMTRSRRFSPSTRSSRRRPSRSSATLSASNSRRSTSSNAATAGTRHAATSSLNGCLKSAPPPRVKARTLPSPVSNSLRARRQRQRGSRGGLARTASRRAHGSQTAARAAAVATSRHQVAARHVRQFVAELLVDGRRQAPRQRGQLRGQSSGQRALAAGRHRCPAGRGNRWRRRSASRRGSASSARRARAGAGRVRGRVAAARSQRSRRMLSSRHACSVRRRLSGSAPRRRAAAPSTGSCAISPTSASNASSRSSSGSSSTPKPGSRPASAAKRLEHELAERMDGAQVQPGGVGQQLLVERGGRRQFLLVGIRPLPSPNSSRSTRRALGRVGQRQLARAPQQAFLDLDGGLAREGDGQDGARMRAGRRLLQAQAQEAVDQRRGLAGAGGGAQHDRMVGLARPRSWMTRAASRAFTRRPPAG